MSTTHRSASTIAASAITTCLLLSGLSSCSDDDATPDPTAAKSGTSETSDGDPAETSEGAAQNGEGSQGVDSGAPGIELDPQGGNAGPQLCELFGTDDVAGWLGSDVGAPEVVAPLDSGCQWVGSDGSVLMIQVMSADYYSPPSMSENYEELTGIGDDAYTSSGLFDDWVASAMVDDEMTIISVEKSDDDKALSVEVLTASLPVLWP